MRVAWLTDIHLECVAQEGIAVLGDEILAETPDAILISGDIGYAYTIRDLLSALQDCIGVHIYFVLGNHDYWGGTIEGTRESVRNLCAEAPGLTWLPQAGVVQLTESVGLVGHGAWADARLGDFDGSTLMMSDFAAIHDFAEPPDAYRRAVEARGVSKVKAEWLFSDEGKVHRRHLMEKLGDEAASYFRTILPQALDANEQVLLLTHVPPFKEAAWCGENISDDSGLPYFVCKAVGDALVGVMKKFEDRQLTVLCGHVHSGGTAQILDNLEVITGAAEYTKPRMERVFEIE